MHFVPAQRCHPPPPAAPVIPPQAHLATFHFTQCRDAGILMEAHTGSVKAMSALQRDPVDELRWIGDAYEQAQRSRIDAGERIRAILQGRDSAGMREDIPVDASVVLRQIRTGAATGPVPLLGWTYRHHWAEEQELRRGMETALLDHPAWPWLRDVKGIGVTLAAKLLGRLDIRRARSPSSFWAYCGLATVPAAEYRCTVCGLSTSFAPAARVAGTHQASGSRRRCSGVLRAVLGPGDGVRMAQPRTRGDRAAYDRRAKKTCYLIGLSLIRAGDTYAAMYRNERTRLEAERAGWTKGRIHLAALRRIEKAFLAALWTAWNEADEQRQHDGAA